MQSDIDHFFQLVARDASDKVAGKRDVMFFNHLVKFCHMFRVKLIQDIKYDTVADAVMGSEHIR
jgi:hypothetical protein